MINRISVILFLSFSLSIQSCSNEESRLYDSISVQTIDSFLLRYPDTIPYDARRFLEHRWGYEQGVMLEAIRRVGDITGDRKYHDYIKRHMDKYIREDGSIDTYEFHSFNIDNIPPGRQLFWLYEETGDEKYRLAIELLRRQLREHPRTNEGGFWHKRVYPYQMWLDGIYMGQPFYAQYASTFGDYEAFDDIANQIIRIEQNTIDEATGLLYHAWDESREMDWADKETGKSPHFWGRAIGWYAMGIVDVLDYFPDDHPRYHTIVEIFQRMSEALLQYQDDETGLWYQVVDLGNRPGNYLESSVTAMLSYSFAKGARMGYLDGRFRDSARRAFNGLLDHKIVIDRLGMVDLHDGASVGGLGGSPYRDGSFNYYINEPRRTNDWKAVGPFVFAALELEQR
jgi:unsaturated rhamnogalacturonyl hydrolase